MFYLIGHNYTSIFRCNEKVVEYIRVGVPCSVFKLKNGKYGISFGRYETKEEAENAVSTIGRKVRIIKQ